MKLCVAKRTAHLLGHARHQPWKLVIALFLVGCGHATPRAATVTPPSPPPRVYAHDAAKQKLKPPESIDFEYDARPKADFAVGLAYFTLDRELKSRFDFGSGHQRFSGTPITFYVGNGTGFADWMTALKDHDRYAKRIDALAELHPSPRYIAILLARRASLADSLWQGITTLEQRGFVLLAPSMPRLVVPCRPMPHCEAAVKRFDDERRRDTDAVARLATAAYAWSIAVAAHYGVHDPNIDRARTRLAVLRKALGANAFERIIASATPPYGVAKNGQRLSLADLGLALGTAAP
jgi:hypothetical protein